MEREPGLENKPAGRSETGVGWSVRVERREAVTLDAYQIDQMVASLGMCVATVYDLAEAVNSDDNKSFRQEMMRSATKNIEEASAFLENLTSDIAK